MLRAEDAVADDEVWNALKRALQDGRTEIRMASGPLGPQPSFLKPEPVALDVKVIILGNETYYDALYNTDDDFPKIFKVSAEFDSTMDRGDKSTKEYVDFLRTLTSEEGLLPLEASGAAAIVEFGVRIAEFRTKLSTRFSQIADLLREGKLLGQESRAVLGGPARGTRPGRAPLPCQSARGKDRRADPLRRDPHGAEGHGRRQDQRSRLLDRGYYAFGRPLVISARTAPGHDGIINVERESGLSGEIHDKGILIIEGYLQSLYARNFPFPFAPAFASNNRT
ncbi:MAG: AAA family ATPase [Candidatus Competibacteraceae bacterium]|nr:AAA family ATPase [Candidatus Competibacteraceae bacterium]